jgi:hypothetical protein
MRWLGFTLALVGLVFAFAFGLAVLVHSVGHQEIHHAFLGLVGGLIAVYGGFALMGRANRSPKDPEASC